MKGQKVAGGGSYVLGFFRARQSVGETCDDEGRPSKVWLYYAKSTSIKRHIKVKGEANPYYPTYQTYFVVTWKPRPFRRR